MTRDNLIEFLKETYEPDTELVWQTMSYEDVENGVDNATPKLWTEFIESLDTYNRLAENFSDDTHNEFFEFVEKTHSQKEDN